MTLGLFAIGGLELLGVLEETISEANRKAWIEWIYSQQRIPSKDSPSGNLLYYPSIESYGASYSLSLSLTLVTPLIPICR